MKKDNFKTFLDEIYRTPPNEIYETNNVIFTHVDEIWSIHLADMIDYKISNNKAFRYIIVKNDNVSKFIGCIPLKQKYGETITKEFSKILTKSKRKPPKIESDR